MSYGKVNSHGDNVPLVQQPEAHAGMMFQAGGNRNAKGKEVHRDGKRDWSHGLCGCCSDCGTCALATCCPCVVYSQNKSRLEHLEQRGGPHPGGGDNCTGDCGIYCCLAFIGVPWILQMMNRGNIRKRYRISGNGCGDCCTSFFCTPCGLTQDSRELELEEHTYH